MDAPQPVRTGSNGQNCVQCGAPLPARPPSAKDHRFCSGSKCRTAWHRREQKRALDAALKWVKEAKSLHERGGVGIEHALGFAKDELLIAGAVERDRTLIETLGDER